MTVADCLRILRERWLTIVLVTLLGGAAGAGLFLALLPPYTAHATLYVSARGAADSQQAFSRAHSCPSNACARTPCW